MAQIQMRSDDTIKWGQGIGSGVDGAYSPSTGTDTPTTTTFSGIADAYTGTVGSNSGFAINNIVLIHQTRNGTPTPGTWQFNYILNIAGTTFTFLYPLVASFNTTAQIQKIPQYSSVNIAGGVTLTGASWNQTTRGIFALFCNGPINIAGTLRIIGAQGATSNALPSTAAGGTGGGFYGGQSHKNNGATSATQGEGTGGVGGAVQDELANGNGGGCFFADTSARSGCGAGGGNGTAGGGGATSSWGGEVGPTAGQIVGNAGLTVMNLGGGGGGAAFNTSGFNAADVMSGGSSGGGIILLIGKTVTVTGTISVNGGEPGNTANTLSGGGGAGGSVLIKGQSVVLGNNLVTALGGTTGFGGDGGNGRIHIDYANSLSGFTNPSLDSRLDASLALLTGSQIIG